MMTAINPNRMPGTIPMKVSVKCVSSDAEANPTKGMYRSLPQNVS